MAYAMGSRPASIKNYRDEFDPLFPNGRKGWHKRPIRGYCLKVFEKYKDLDLESFSSLVKSLVGYDEFFRSLQGSQLKAFSPDRAVRDAAAEQHIEMGESVAPQADMFACVGYQKIIAGDTTPAETLEANYIRASDAELFSLPKLMP